MKIKLKKGDEVIVLAGKDKGKTGEVLKVFPTKSRAVVQGVNMFKRHTAPSQAGPGGIVEKEGSIHKIGAYVQNKPACNGWTYWFVRYNNKIVSINDHRNFLREESSSKE